MKKEYLYLERDPLEFPLDESIDVTTKAQHSDYIVSNVENDNSQVYAFEIDYYIKNTQDDIPQQMKSIKKLYDVRAIVYDLAQDMDYTQKVGKKVLIVLREKNSDLIDKLQKDDFVCLEISPDDILDVSGHIGALKIKTTKLMRVELEIDQVIWLDAPQFATKQSGVYDPAVDGWASSISKVYKNVDTFKYKNFVYYNPNICQYQGRILEETCGKCEEVCPSVAITKTDDDKQLHFSDIDCHGCGGCVSVCPSGALDFTQMPKDAFFELSSLYAGHTALITPAQVEMPNIPLPCNVLPLAIEGRKFLHEAHLLALLQKSGNSIIFYTDFVSKGTGDAIDIVNEIFWRKYQKRAIQVCMSSDELMEALKNRENISECMFEMNDSELNKREVFTYRLSKLVGDDDLGVVETGEHIHYGNLKINEDTCTLCMSCVGVCNVSALTAHPEDNTLKFNPSICTNCGYCEVACPEENCIETIYDQLSLNKSYFIKNTMAHDNLFECVECGTEFATQKSIEKIANMMIPRFGGDEVKIRTLYCCADCKPKVMLQAHINSNTGAI